MRVWDVLGRLAVGLALAGCAAAPQVGAGEPCNSLNECKPGLSCIEGTCDGDLTSIAGQVPVYGDAAPMAGGASADGSAATTAGTGGDGATSVGPNDAGTADR